MDWNIFSSHIRHLTAEEKQRVHDAFVFGEKAHEGQKRKSGEPFFSHPIAVAQALADMGADADTLIAALLHDAVEDTPLTLGQIDAQFNGSVRSLIDGVTKLDESDLSKPTQDSQIETLRKIFTLMQQDIRIMAIKLADRLHNMQTVRYLAPERQQTLAKETKEVYVKIADRLSMQDLRDALEELCLDVLDQDLLKKLKQLKVKNEKKGDQIMEEMKQDLKTHDAKFSFKTSNEPKSWGKLNDQLNAEHVAITGLSDVTIVFLCDAVDACYQMLGLLHKVWQRETLSFQDFINSPAINGYKGLHTTVIMEDGTRVRCKIRTQEMHMYARKGITMLCFDDRAAGVLDYLPWTKRIEPLSADTANRSEEFWESLKSDILGESIMVHGVGDTAVMLPEGSTALDGAFYCYHEKALRAEKIFVNGREVPFSVPLTHGVSLAINLSSRSTVQREWLQWVSTGFATAMIREAIATSSEQKKMKVGKELLQDVLREKKRGFIEEFDRKTLGDRLHVMGYDSMESAYLAIADGRLKPITLYESIFEPRKQQDAQRVNIITFSLPAENVPTEDLTRIYGKYKNVFRSLHFWFNVFRRHWNVRIVTRMNAQDIRKAISDLNEIGVRNLSIRSQYTRFNFFIGISIIIILWGLDPAVGHWLIITHGIAPIDLTLVRFWSLTTISALLLIAQRIRAGVPEKRVSLNNASLWMSVGLLICIAMTTYISLETTSPIRYTIPMTAAGVLMTTIVNRKRWKMLILTWLLVVSGIAMMMWEADWSPTGIIFTILAVVSFSAFSVVSERYKREEFIAARVAQYFFVISVLCSIFTVPLAYYATLGMYSPSVILQMIAFSICLAGLPYYIYYFYLSHKAIDFVLQYSFLIIFTTLFGQLILFGWNASIPTVVAGVLVIIGAMLPILKK